VLAPMVRWKCQPNGGVLVPKGGQWVGVEVAGIERFCGVAAGQLGLITLVVVLVVPLARRPVESCSSTPPGGWPVQVACVDFTAPPPPVDADGAALPLLVTCMLASMGIAPGAYRHARRSLPPARTQLWLSAAALHIAALAHLSLAVYFLPGGTPAVLASLAAARPGPHPAPTAVPTV
jgi:hypothetical protein